MYPYNDYTILMIDCIRRDEAQRRREAEQRRREALQIKALEKRASNPDWWKHLLASLFSAKPEPKTGVDTPRAYSPCGGSATEMTG